MAEYNMDDQGVSRERELLVAHPIQAHHDLVKANRFLVRLVCVLVCMVFALGLLLAPKQTMLDVITRNQAQHPLVQAQNSGLTADINALKSQMFSLVSGSVDAKLKSLEESLRRGNLSESLDALQSLKNDVRLLTDAAPPLNADKGQIQGLSEQQVFKELSELKSLVYLTFISCGLIIAALAGVWLRYRYRISYQKREFLGRKS